MRPVGEVGERTSPSRGEGGRGTLTSSREVVVVNGVNPMPAPATSSSSSKGDAILAVEAWVKDCPPTGAAADDEEVGGGGMAKAAAEDEEEETGAGAGGVGMCSCSPWL